MGAAGRARAKFQWSRQDDGARLMGARAMHIVFGAGSVWRSASQAAWPAARPTDLDAQPTQFECRPIYYCCLCARPGAQNSAHLHDTAAA